MTICAGERLRLGIQILVALLCCGLFAPTVLHGSADIRRYAEAYQQLNSAQQAQVKDMANQLRCPTCTGLSVLESDAPFSLQMRTAVLEQVKQGRSNEQIKQFFIERYGLWILREPPRQGLHLLAWIIPCLVLIAGPLVLLLRRRRQVKHGGTKAAAGQLRSRQDIIEQMQAALAERRSQRRREGAR